MVTEVIVKNGKIYCTFVITEGNDIVIKLSPNEARNFKAQIEAALKSLGG